MRDTDRRAFAAVMATVGETYQREISRSLMTIYFEALRDRPLEDVQRAVETLIKSSTWLPRPSEIRDAIRRRDLATRDTRGDVGEPAPAIPATVEARRRLARADPAVRVSVELQRAWADRCEAVAGGLEVSAADLGFGVVLREVLPVQATDPLCGCHLGLMAVWRNGYRLDRPCACRAGDPWRAKAQAADEARRWTVRKILKAPRGGGR